MKIGLISDTHGLLRPEALAALHDSTQVIHAGDIGKPEILDALRELAPLTVVRGNNDQDDAWASTIPTSAVLRVGGVGIYVTHELADVPEQLPAGIDVVVTGHSHKPLQQVRHGVLFINPGSAGPRRFKLPISVGLLHLDAGVMRGELIELA
ncbi:metallophosphoesterase family protein [Aquipseudomonas ullengensis]|uniref:Phosphoesterase n=1 Tax=Aquipseudomonas ullengensis TaxID=2759166 RepID=A0A7W4LPQ8_9GAMM|nr:metallophosphoesterase family protein [Pseudomonas ullengensis]MBB2496910.1 metallophosphoesterase family protein [Pseudomonas ullengensis]